MKKEIPSKVSNEKPKPNLLSCCLCFRRDSNTSETSIIGISNKNEPYEYVVEKLAIKRVPLSLFAIDEDLEDRQCYQSYYDSESTMASVASKKVPPPVSIMPEKKSNVTFSSYYALVPKSEVQGVTSRPVVTEPGPFEDEDEIEIDNTMHPQHIEARVVLNEDQEKEMVSKILNQCSSLYTLDPKNPVPKDPTPLNPPRTRSMPEEVVPLTQQGTCGPRCGQKVIIQQAHIKAEIEQAEQPKSRGGFPLIRKEMSPEIQHTINALGVAQKPPLYSARQRNQSLIRRRSRSKELACSLLAGDHQHHELKDAQSKKLTSQPYKDEDVISPCKACRERKVDDDSYWVHLPRQEVATASVEEKPYHGNQGYEGYMEDSIFPTRRSSPNVPFKTETALPSTSTVMSGTLFKPPLLPSTPSQRIASGRETGDETTRSDESEQITEITQMKGHSLKWKIIIKHHTTEKETPADKLALESGLDETDSETDDGSPRPPSPSPT